MLTDKACKEILGEVIPEPEAIAFIIAVGGNICCNIQS